MTYRVQTVTLNTCIQGSFIGKFFSWLFQNHRCGTTQCAICFATGCYFFLLPRISSFFICFGAENLYIVFFRTPRKSTLSSKTAIGIWKRNPMLQINPIPQMKSKSFRGNLVKIYKCLQLL